jgi:DNA replicative helicase MCM subunit Mcm2 (Cdc46/Mcm family)
MTSNNNADVPPEFNPEDNNNKEESMTKELRYARISLHDLRLVVNDRYSKELNRQNLLRHRQKHVAEKLLEVCMDHQLDYHKDTDLGYLEGLANDVFENYEVDELEQKIEAARRLKRLTDIENPKHANKEVVVKAVLTTRPVAYIVPKTLHAECQKIHDENHSHSKSQLTFNLEPEEMAEYTDNRNRENQNVHLAKRQRPTENEKGEIDIQKRMDKWCPLQITEVAQDTIYRARIVPHSVSLIFEKDIRAVIDEATGGQYQTYDVYIAGKRAKDLEELEPGTVYRIVGKVIPDHRSQKATLCIIKLAKDTSNKFDVKNLTALRELFQGKTIEQRIDWYVDNFEKYSKIVKRRDVAIGSLLACFSPTYIRFGDDEFKPIRGWVLLLVVGDTTTGKSEVAKATIALIEDGQYMTAEIASVVGLSGAVVSFKDGGSWVIDWGALPLNHKKALVVDGAQKLPKSQHDALAEAQRSGEVRIQKVAKGQANARTRQIIIANPVHLSANSSNSDDSSSGGFRTTRKMSSFMFPYQAISTVLNLQSIARYDFAVLVSADDVGIEEINDEEVLNGKPAPELFYYKDLRGLCWDDSKYQVDYESGFVKEVLEQANKLYNKFYSSDVPLVAADIRYKIARLSVALALATCNFDATFSKLSVTKNHVQYIVNFLDDIYTKAGLDKAAEENKAKTTDIEANYAEAKEVIDKIYKELAIDNNKAIEILRWIAKQTPSFSKPQLKMQFSLPDKSGIRELLPILKNAEIIKNTQGGFVITEKGVNLVKAIDAKLEAEKKKKQDDNNDNPPLQKGNDDGKDGGGGPVSGCGKYGKCGKTGSESTQFATVATIATVKNRGGGSDDDDVRSDIKQKQPGKSAYEAWLAACMADLEEFGGKVRLSKRLPMEKRPPPKDGGLPPEIPEPPAFEVPCPLCDYKVSNQIPDAAIFSVAITHGFTEHPGHKVGEMLREMGYVTTSSVNNADGGGDSAGDDEKKKQEAKPPTYFACPESGCEEQLEGPVKLLEHIHQHCPEREASTREWLQARGLLLPEEPSS